MAVKQHESSERLRRSAVAMLLCVFLATALAAMLTAPRVVSELAWMGMTVRPLSPEAAMARGMPRDQGGLVVEDADGVAATAGLREGDVLLSINGTPVLDLADFSRVTGETSVLNGVTLDVVRQGALRSLLLRGTAPAKGGTAAPGAMHPAHVMGRRWLGVEAENFTAGDRKELGIPAGIRGVLIDGVAGNSRAERAGLLPNDLIVAVNRQKINSTTDLWRILGSLSVTAPLEFGLYRDGKPTSVRLSGEPGTQVGGFFPVVAGQGVGAPQCLVCPVCRTTVLPPAGASYRTLRCPACGGRMQSRQQR